MKDNDKSAVVPVPCSCWTSDLCGVERWSIMKKKEKEFILAEYKKHSYEKQRMLERGW